MDKQVKYIRPSHGKKDWQDLRDIIGFLFQKTDKGLKITIEENADTRKQRQNRLLWMWHNELKKHIEKYQGQIFDAEDIHDYVVGELLPKRVVHIGEEPEIHRTRTSKLKVKEFAKFLDKYEMWASDNYQCFFTQPIDLYLEALMKDSEEEQTDGL